MSLSAAQSSELEAQHSLQGEDWLSICTLSGVEGVFESAQSWSFEEFLGFTLHLFITADSAHVRAQVAQKLPKFGSRIVLPLVNILHHFQAIANTQTDAQTSALASDVSALAAQSLNQIAPNCLAAIAGERSDSILSQISELLSSDLLSKENRQCLETQRQLNKAVLSSDQAKRTQVKRIQRKSTEKRTPIAIKATKPKPAAFIVAPVSFCR